MHGKCIAINVVVEINNHKIVLLVTILYENNVMSGLKKGLFRPLYLQIFIC